MTDRSQLAAEVAASAAAATGASKVTVAGSGVAGFGWLLNSEPIALMGGILAVLGFVINIYFQRRAARFQAIEHQAELEAHAAMRDYWISRRRIGDE